MILDVTDVTVTVYMGKDIEQVLRPKLVIRLLSNVEKNKHPRPASAIAIAEARPIPCPAAVTNAVLPVSLCTERDVTIS